MKIKFDVVWEVWICSRKPENHQTFEGLSIKFLSIMCHFGNFNEYILKIEYFYKILKNMQHINSNFQTGSLPWESGEFACLGFCEWVQNGIDACISHRIYQPSLLSMIFSSLRCCHSSKKPTFCLNQLRKSPASKVKSKQASCKIISLQTSLQIIAKRFLKLPNKMKESITSQKLGSQDFRTSIRTSIQQPGGAIFYIWSIKIVSEIIF